jgi:hypothetical protein
MHGFMHDQTIESDPRKEWRQNIVSDPPEVLMVLSKL